MASEDESCTANFCFSPETTMEVEVKKKFFLCHARIFLGSSYSLSGHSNKIGSWPKGYRLWIQFSLYCIKICLDY